MKSEDIAAFVAVVKCGSVSRAAEALQLPQSVVTRRVQRFEDWLGAQLFDRNAKPLKPSPLALDVYRQCRFTLRQLEHIKELVATPEKPSGTLRVGAPQFISESILLNVIRCLNAKFPDLRIEITSAFSPALIQGVEEGDLDAALIVAPKLAAESGRAIGRQLVSFEIEVVAPKDDLARRPYTLRDVYDRGWILNPSGCGFRTTLENRLATKGLDLKVNLEVFGTEVQLGLVANGMGLGLVPERFFARSPNYARVQRLNLTDFKMLTKLWLLRHVRSKAPTTALTEFGSQVRRCFQNELA